jgi:lysine 2,3-aminomutase
MSVRSIAASASAAKSRPRRRGPISDQLEAALAYIRARPEIWEVILTGGDPLMLAPRRLAELTTALDAIPHIGVIRIHSRVPIVDPGRMTDELVAALRPRRATLWFGVHCNHPRELAAPTRAALARLADAGIPLMGQTVLLAGINDDVETLDQLMRALVTARVKPYYLHHPTWCAAPAISGCRWNGARP